MDITKVVLRDANFFQMAFKQLLNGIVVENGKLLMHIFA